MQWLSITTYIVSSNPTHCDRGVFGTTLCDKVCQSLVVGMWFSLVFSTDKSDRHDIAKMLLKVALNTISLYTAHPCVTATSERVCGIFFTVGECVKALLIFALYVFGHCWESSYHCRQVFVLWFIFAFSHFFFFFIK